MSTKQLLYTCPACKNTVAKAATACPHCGQPSPKAKETNNLRNLLFLILVAISAFLGFMFLKDKQGRDQERARIEWQTQNRNNRIAREKIAADKAEADLKLERQLRDIKRGILYTP